MSRVFLATPEASDEATFLAAVLASRDLHADYVAPPQHERGVRGVRRPHRQAELRRHLIKLRENAELVGVVNINEIVRGCFRARISATTGSLRTRARA